MDNLAIAGSIARWMRIQGWEVKAVSTSNKELIPCTSDAEWHSRQERRRQDTEGSFWLRMTRCECDCLCQRQIQRHHNNVHAHTALTDFISWLMKSFPASHHDTHWFLFLLVGHWGYFPPASLFLFPSTWPKHHRYRYLLNNVRQWKDAWLWAGICIGLTVFFSEVFLHARLRAFESDKQAHCFTKLRTYVSHNSAFFYYILSHDKCKSNTCCKKSTGDCWAVIKLHKDKSSPSQIPPKQKSLNHSASIPQYCNRLLKIMKCFKLDNMCFSTLLEGKHERQSRKYLIMDERIITQYKKNRHNSQLKTRHWTWIHG